MEKKTNSLLQLTFLFAVSFVITFNTQAHWEDYKKLYTSPNY